MSYFYLFKIKWKKVFDIEEHIYTSLSVEGKKKALRDSLKFLFFNRPRIPNKKIDTDFLFVKVLQRSDYNDLFKKITSACFENKYVLNITYTPAKSIRKYPVYIFIKYFPVFILRLKWSPRKSLYLFYKMIQYLEVYEKINKKINYNKLVVFSDMQAIENLLVQTAKMNGAITVTLQHGLYIDYTKMENINSVNYKNQVTDFFLAWGDSTKNLIEQFNPQTKVEVCGKPIEMKEIPAEKSDYFTILFDQNLLKKYNHKILDIAYFLCEKTGLKINIRFHPHNRKSAYKIDDDVIYVNKNIESSAFILAHTTSLIHELLRTGMPVFKLNSNVPALGVPKSLTFSTGDDVLQILKNQSDQTQNFTEYGKEFLLFTGDESLIKYSGFFKGLRNA